MVLWTSSLPFFGSSLLRAVVWSRRLYSSRLRTLSTYRRWQWWCWITMLRWCWFMPSWCRSRRTRCSSSCFPIRGVHRSGCSWSFWFWRWRCWGSAWNACIAGCCCQCCLTCHWRSFEGERCCWVGLWGLIFQVGCRIDYRFWGGRASWCRCCKGKGLRAGGIWLVSYRLSSCGCSSCLGRVACFSCFFGL